MRGFDGVRYAEITIPKVGPVPEILAHLVPDWEWLNGATLKVAVAHGTANAKRVMDDIKAGGRFSECHFIEFMACPGGCLGGGGQPIPTSAEIRAARAKAIYAEDKAYDVRKSYENPAVAATYAEFLTDGPCGHKSHELAAHELRRERQAHPAGLTPWAAGGAAAEDEVPGARARPAPRRVTPPRHPTCCHPRALTLQSMSTVRPRSPGTHARGRSPRRRRDLLTGDPAGKTDDRASVRLPGRRPRPRLCAATSAASAPRAAPWARRRRSPHDVMRLVASGRTARVAVDESIWLCLTCETCSARCPNDCDPAGVIDALRELSLDAGLADAPRRIAAFHRAFLAQIESNGRSTRWAWSWTTSSAPAT